MALSVSELQSKAAPAAAQPTLVPADALSGVAPSHITKLNAVANSDLFAGTTAANQPVTLALFKRVLGSPNEVRPHWMKRLYAGADAVARSELPEAEVYGVLRAWSAESEKFDPAEFDKQWRSVLDRARSGSVKKPTTIATLIHEAGGLAALQGGTVHPTASNEHSYIKRSRISHADASVDAAQAAAGKLRYYVPAGVWYVLGRGVWRRDPVAAAQFVKEYIAAGRDALLASFKDMDSDQVKSWYRVVLDIDRRLLAGSGVDQVLKLMQGEGSLRFDGRFNATPEMVCDAAGQAVCLRTGAVRPALGVDSFSLCLAVAYDPAALCPAFDKFLVEVMPDPEERAALLRFLGYCLTGHSREERLAFFIGHGSNGKSTLLNVVKSLMGGYGVMAAASVMIDAGKGATSGPRSDLMALEGAHLAVVNETNQEAALDDGQVKVLVSTGAYSARGNHQAQQEIPITAKLVLATNHAPVIRGTDNGIWRRLMLFYFRVQFDDAVKDTTLGARLEAERAGILALLVREAQAYLREGLLIPESMRRAVSAYRTESDLFGEFIAESCTVDPAGEVPFSNLYGVYQNHCERNGTKAASSKWLSRKMQERGFSTVSKRVEGKVCKVVVGLSFA